MTPEERPSPPTGRRSNGLPAASWAAVGDVDPRQAGDLLAALGGAGIAAYVTPSTGSVGAYLSVQLPARPLDRLHVDAARRFDAVAVVRAELDGDRTPSDEDEAFAAIVAGWGTTVAHPLEPQPPLEQPGGPPARPPRPAGVLRPPRRRAGDQPQDAPAPEPADGRPDSEEHAADSEEHAADDEPGADDDHYVAPPPPPLPRWQRPTLVCVLAVVLGLGVLGWTSISHESSQLMLLAGVLLIAGGTAGLVSRLRDSTEEEGDDGAVV